MPSDTPPARVKKPWRMPRELREGDWIMRWSFRARRRRELGIRNHRPHEYCETGGYGFRPSLRSAGMTREGSQVKSRQALELRVGDRQHLEQRPHLVRPG